MSAISREPLLEIIRDFVCRYLPAWTRNKKYSAILKKMAAILKRYRLLFNAISQELLNQITPDFVCMFFCMWETTVCPARTEKGMVTLQ